MSQLNQRLLGPWENADGQLRPRLTMAEAVAQLYEWSTEYRDHPELARDFAVMAAVYHVSPSAWRSERLGGADRDARSLGEGRRLYPWHCTPTLAWSKTIISGSPTCSSARAPTRRKCNACCRLTSSLCRRSPRGYAIWAEGLLAEAFACFPTAAFPALSEKSLNF